MLVSNCIMCDAEFEHSRKSKKTCSNECRNRRSKVDCGYVMFGPDLPPGMKVCRGCCQLLPLERFGRIETEKRLSLPPSQQVQARCFDCTRSKQFVWSREKKGYPAMGPLPRRSKPIGSTYIHRGYVLEKVGVDESAHHRANKHGWVYQHILVAEEKYGLNITRDFTVHHKNGNRSDNSPANLELRVGNHGKCADFAPALIANPASLKLILDHLSEMGYTIIPPEGERA